LPEQKKIAKEFAPLGLAVIIQTGKRRRVTPDGHGIASRAKGTLTKRKVEYQMNIWSAIVGAIRWLWWALTVATC
jgi:hypothetical protein